MAISIRSAVPADRAFVEGLAARLVDGFDVPAHRTKPELIEGDRRALEAWFSNPGKPDEALAVADEIAKSTNAPPAETIEAELIAAEALLSADRVDEAEHRLTQVESRLDPRTTPGAWGEFLRLRGDLRARQF